MKTIGSVPLFAILIGVVPLVSACGKQAEVPAPTPVATNPAPVQTTDDDAARRAEEEARLRAAEEARRIQALLEQTVFFDYDQADIRQDTRSALDAKVPVLRERAAVRLRIEGHADERGSTEYNLALGMRRAVTVKDYLAGFGLRSPAVFLPGCSTATSPRSRSSTSASSRCSMP